MNSLPYFWSRAFIDQFVDQMNHDPSFQKTVAEFSNTVVFRCFDRPDGKDVVAAYHFDEGYVNVEITEVGSTGEIREVAFDSRSALARASAPYTVWAKLDRGKMTVVGALASPEYVIDGPRFKIMLNIAVFKAMSTLSSRIEKQY